MNKIIDVRSDTVTLPTPEMYDAMAHAVCGDDVYEDDLTVKELEQLAADVTGKEAGLFVVSGTFGNQLAIFTHCERGDELIVGQNSHIMAHEVGGAAVIAGVATRDIPTEYGFMDPKLIEERIRKTDNIHYPKTGLIAIENAQADGTVMTVENMASIKKIAEHYGIPVHMDGARLFNAAESLNVDVKIIAGFADSIMFCVSKGLAAPIGSLLVGTKEFIEKARKKRKLLGGGLRQAGVLAAPGIIAIKEMSKRLGNDHDNAKRLANLLDEIPGVCVDKKRLLINMVYFTIKIEKEEELIEKMRKRGIQMCASENGEFRMVTNYMVTSEDVDYIAKSLEEILKAEEK